MCFRQEEVPIWEKNDVSIGKSDSHSTFFQDSELERDTLQRLETLQMSNAAKATSQVVKTKRANSF